jgi:Mor family transcriptional regulator
MTRKQIAARKANVKVLLGYNAGRSIQELAREHGVSPQAIHERLKKMGYTPRRLRRVPPISDEAFNASLREEYESGITADTLAQRHGMSQSGIFYRLHQLGVKIRPQGSRLKRTDLQRMREEYESGLSLPELGRRHGISYAAARMRLLKSGATPRPKSEAIKMKRRSMPKPMIDLPSDEIKSQYERGSSTLELAQRYNRSVSSIRKLLIKSGVSFRSLSQANALVLQKRAMATAAAA